MQAHNSMTSSYATRLDLSMITMMYVVGTVVRNNNLVGTDDLVPTCYAASQGHPAVAQCYYEVSVQAAIVAGE